ncbi:MAG: HAMP domain-containing histidine kinase [Flavobacteriaceae bacterium]|nr:HAMP domain-containing histidine kinase [Flavobacteriaceae bacterium]
MIPQRKILKGVAIFLTCYMIAALTWWTYSLLKYSQRDYQLNKEILALESELLLKKVQMQFQIDSIADDTLFIKSNQTQCNHIDRSIHYFISKETQKFQVFSAYNPQLQILKIHLKIKNKLLGSINDKLEAKTRAWLGEGITIGILTLLVIGAMYIYIDRIIQFNQQKSNFLLAVTHELKTPIAAAKLAIQTLVRNKNKDKQERVLAISEQNMDRLSKLMERILLATQFESTLPRANKQWISVSKIVAMAISHAQFTSDQLQKIDISKTSDFEIFCDPEMVKIAFANILTNGIKYCEKDSESIKIESFIQNGQYHTEFSDQGFGISPSERLRIFQKFYRIGDEKTRSRQGSGLGLYLVKSILQLHSAHILVTNNHPKGSKFSIIYDSKQCKLT